MFVIYDRFRRSRTQPWWFGNIIEEKMPPIYIKLTWCVPDSESSVARKSSLRLRKPKKYKCFHHIAGFNKKLKAYLHMY